MKKLFFLFLVCFLAVGVQAQSTGKMKMTHKSGAMGKDCVMMDDGKMMVMKGGKTMAMDQDMTMSNGTMVMSDGTVKMKNGKTMMLKNGDCVWMNGTVTHKKMKGKMMEKDKM